MVAATGFRQNFSCETKKRKLALFEGCVNHYFESCRYQYHVGMSGFNMDRAALNLTGTFLTWLSWTGLD